MARFTFAATILFVAVLCGAAPSVTAQWIIQDEPPRPPGDVPNVRPGPGMAPPPYERRQYPPPRQSLPPQPLDVTPAPARMPPSAYPPQGPSPGPSSYPPPTTYPPSNGFPPPSGYTRGTPRGDGSIKSQPLPPPPGATAAPVEAAKPSTNPTNQAPANPANAPAQQDAGLPPEETVVTPPPERITNPVAVFAGLDKITGRITSFDVKIGETVQFGALQVTPRACYSRPPTEPPRTDAFLAVDEVTLTGEVKRIFTGWMFASSPGLHAVEHPIYDIWLTACKGGQLNVAGADDKASAQAADQASPKSSRTQRRR